MKLFITHKKYIIGLIGISFIAIVLLVMFTANKPDITNQGAGPKAANIVQKPVSDNANKSESSVTSDRLSIPKIGIDAAVQAVGITKEGDMDAPNNGVDVGWYKLGVSPGEIGNAVIGGHVSTRQGDAVFKNLHNLNSGDTFSVTKDNKKLTFRVSHSQLYDENNAPLEEIFGTTSKARLNLITCGGSWDGQARQYSHRLVVFSELISNS